MLMVIIKIILKAETMRLSLSQIDIGSHFGTAFEE